MARILVIDDEAEVRTVLRRALEKAGHEVVEAEDGKEGMRSYRRVGADLVITDILMPEQDGLQCILELRRLDPQLPVIAMSGGSTRVTIDVLEDARRFGARQTFEKPFDVSAVVAAVEAELRKRSPA